MKLAESWYDQAGSTYKMKLRIETTRYTAEVGISDRSWEGESLPELTKHSERVEKIQPGLHPRFRAIPDDKLEGDVSVGYLMTVVQPAPGCVSLQLSRQGTDISTIPMVNIVAIVVGDWVYCRVQSWW
jgi:hypothetical protein